MTGACVIPRLKKKLLGLSLAPSPARSRPLGPAKSFLGQSVRHPFPKRMREPSWSASPEPGLTKEQRSGPERCPGPGPANTSGLRLPAGNGSCCSWNPAQHRHKPRPEWSRPFRTSPRSNINSEQSAAAPRPELCGENIPKVGFSPS